MRFSLNFIKDFLEVNISPDKLASLLTMAGMEVQHWEKIGDDWVFDVEITSNRYDWLSIIGIAREIAACLCRSLKVDYPKVKKEAVLKDISIFIENTQDCPFYIGRVIEKVEIGDSPAWLKERILNCGINSINNIVDITNYCMLKWGNPLHAFDKDKIRGNIYVRRAKEGEVFVGIDEKERVLKRENLVIADDKKVIALAGVIGGKNTEVDGQTKNIFLEAAIFSPLTIRRSRRIAGLDTESSYRFERSLCPDYLENASYQAGDLIGQIAKGVNRGVRQAGKKPPVPKNKIAVSISHLNNYLGGEFPKAKVKKILSNLNFEVKDSSPDKFFVYPPCFRFDVKREVDVYEEFARSFGYEKIDVKLPPLTPLLQEDKIYKFKKELGEFMSLLGFREIITYSIEAEEDLAKLGEKNYINIENPLRKQENVLRPSLLLGMMKSIQYNLNRGQRGLRFFEIANVYLKTSNAFMERPFLSAAMMGEKSNFFYLKGAVEKILRFLNIDDIKFKEGKTNNFTSALKITTGQKEIGFLGKLDKKVKDSFDLKEDIFFVQLDVLSLYNVKKDRIYQPFSLYPAVWRDISLVLSKDKKFKEVEQIIRDKGENIAGLEVVSVYCGKDLSAEETAFTLRVFYQSRQRTLTAGEVDSRHKNIRDALYQQEGITLR